jgi:hypothetical protein
MNLLPDALANHQSKGSQQICNDLFGFFFLTPLWRFLADAYWLFLPDTIWRISPDPNK